MWPFLKIHFIVMSCQFSGNSIASCTNEQNSYYAFTGGIFQVNCVVMRGLNDDEICDFVALTEEKVRYRRGGMGRKTSSLRRSNSTERFHRQAAQCWSVVVAPLYIHAPLCTTIHTCAIMHHYTYMRPYVSEYRCTIHRVHAI